VRGYLQHQFAPAFLCISTSGLASPLTRISHHLFGSIYPETSWVPQSLTFQTPLLTFTGPRFEGQSRTSLPQTLKHIQTGYV
jgi:predicted secreted Zn-dependent protease